jgi:hypothetical protein
LLGSYGEPTLQTIVIVTLGGMQILEYVSSSLVVNDMLLQYLPLGCLCVICKTM